MSFFVNLVTLNCWAIAQPWPFGSKDRKERLKRLVDALEESDYDIVTLQEIWSEKDFDKISTNLAHVYPYSHYFHSGFTGSGTCILSKYMIVSTLVHRYSLNGFAHHIHRGDWFGGKVVGLAELNVKGLRVAIYTTHLHAEYNRDNDLYLPHRISQAFELAQFLDHTSRSSDFVILTGDFNIEPEDLGYHIIAKIANLEDAWLKRPSTHGSNDNGMTCDRPDNCYTNKHQLKRWPEGKRIDYIMYQSGKKHIELVECLTCLDKIPGSKLNYSDHIGLHAKFKISTG
uniref:sphingomyelin phosphodiesterase n=1 Tax=Acrobeloides nanus TaxID=290746 RepID=A0A914CZA4_9BILA